MHGPTRFAQPQLAEYISEGLDGVDVRLRGREAGTHRVDRDVARTQGTPCFDAPTPFAFIKALNADPGVNAKAFGIAPDLFEIPMELSYVGFDPVVRWPARRH